MQLVKDKNVLITGGSKGIGKAIAQTFAEQRANVGFTYLSSEEKAKALEAELKEKGVQAKAYKSDASDFEAAQNLVDDFVETFGSLDVLINNAGITKDGLLMRMSEDQFDDVIRVNLKSIFNLTKAATRTLMKQRQGSIINMSSVVGAKGNAGQANYAASKSGIIGFSKSVALELASRNIRCNVVAPGFIETAMTEELEEKTLEEWRAAIPMKRGGSPKEVADLCVYLGSDMSSYITGECIHINGGMYT